MSVTPDPAARLGKRRSHPPPQQMAGDGDDADRLADHVVQPDPAVGLGAGQRHHVCYCDLVMAAA